MTEDEAVEITRWGDPPQIADPKEHTEIGDFDLERGAKVSGSRFGFILGDTALLALALYRLALDRLVREGFTPVLPPVLVRVSDRHEYPAQWMQAQVVLAVAEPDRLLAREAEAVGDELQPRALRHIRMREPRGRTAATSR